MIENIKNSVKSLLQNDDTGHGFDHVLRVFDTTQQILKTQTEANETVTLLAALLHDVDDYKLFETSEKLSNAKNIMKNAGVDENVQKLVLDVIAQIGYSKRLKGLQPTLLEAKIVSDADMLDAIGINGIIRCLNYAFARCQTVVFDEKVWPEVDISYQRYKLPNRKSDNFINHFFEKLLKIKDMLYTDYAIEEGKIRHKCMVDFLTHFFREQHLTEWQNFLQDYCSKLNKIS